MVSCEMVKQLKQKKIRDQIWLRQNKTKKNQSKMKRKKKTNKTLNQKSKSENDGPRNGNN